MKKNIFLFVFLFVFYIKKSFAYIFIDYIYNNQEYINIVLNNLQITEANIFINDYNITSLCTYYSGSQMFQCTNLPIDDRIRSGTFKVTNATDSGSVTYYFGPQILSLVYPNSDNRLPTTGGTVTIKGRFFDTTLYSGANNGLYLTYQRVTLPTSSYQIVDSQTVIVQIPEGSGGYGTGRVDNPLFVTSLYNNNSVIGSSIWYYGPSFTSFSYEENGSNMVINGNNFGNSSNLIRVFACDHELSNIQLSVPHQQAKAYYDLNALNNKSCPYVTISVNSLNSTFGIFILPPKITSISTPPILGGNITINGNFLSNQLNGENDLAWRISINGIEYPSTKCSSLKTYQLICNSPPGTTDITVYIKSYSTYYSPNVTVPYLTQIVSSTSGLYYSSPGIVTIYGANFFGENLQILIGGKVCTSPLFYNSSTIACSFSADIISVNKVGLEVSVSSVNDVVNVPNSFLYNPAIFTDIIQNEDDLQLMGNYFSPNMTIVIGSNGITGYCTITSLTLINCINVPTIPSGDVILTASKDSIYSNFIFTPWLMSSSNSIIPTMGQKVTLTGKYFELYVDVLQPQLQTLSINTNVSGVSTQYSQLKLLSNSQIEFTIPPGSANGKTNTISIQSKDKISNTIDFIYYDYVKINNVVQLNQGLQITGYGFTISGMVLKFGDLDISSNCIVSNDSLITCETLPMSVQSSELLIANNKGSSKYRVYLNPLIFTLSNSILNTNGETITVTGRFFELVDPFTNYTNNIKLIVDNKNEMIINSVDDLETIVATISNGYGINHNIIVSINDTRISNLVLYSYIPPVIHSIKQNLDQFYINASHFSYSNISLNSIYLNNNKLSINPVIVNNSFISFTLDSTSQNGEIYLIVDGQSSNSIDVYLEPIIKSFSPAKPYMDGSIDITVVGLYFSNRNSKTNNLITLNLNYIVDLESLNNSLICDYINGYTLICKNLKGYGTGKLQFTKIDNSIETKSNIYSFSYSPPIIVKSTSIYYNQPNSIRITCESFLPDDLQVYVENVECLNPVALNNRLIECYFDGSAAPNENGNSLNISVISKGMMGSNQVFYYNDLIDCPNNCSNSQQGTCNQVNGECICLSGFSGIDCSIEKPNEIVPPPEINDKGEANLGGSQNNNFTISISHLRELDIYGNQVKVLPISSITWVNKSRVSNDTTYYKGIFNDSLVVIELNVAYYQNAENYDFAGDIVSIPENSIKYVITVSNWEFESHLNTFQLIYNSQTKAKVNQGCNQVDTTSSSSDQTQSVSWFQVISGNSILNGRFSRRMFVDSVVRKSSVSLLDFNDPLYALVNESSSNDSFNKLTAINTPYFNDNIILDPSFNSLFMSSSESDSCENKWKIPVIASVSSVVGVAIIVGSAVTIYKVKKNRSFVKKIKTLSKNNNQ